MPDAVSAEIGPFAPSPGILRNTHMQSILASSEWRIGQIKDKVERLAANSKPMLLNGQHALLLAWHTPQPQPDAPMVVLFHGWEGSTESAYLRSAAAACYERGFQVLRLNYRDHGGTHHLNRDMFHSCRLDEVVNALTVAVEQLRPQKIYLAGFSLGGNFALRTTLAAPAQGLTFDGTIAVCPAIDPKSTMHAINDGALIYRKYFTRKWKRSLLKKAACHPEQFDSEKWRHLDNIIDMTNYFVSNFTDYPDSDSYFQGYTLTQQMLSQLRSKTLIINSKDDPVCLIEVLEQLSETEQLQILLADYGGHCGFIENFAMDSWVEKHMAARFTL